MTEQERYVVTKDDELYVVVDTADYVSIAKRMYLPHAIHLADYLNILNKEQDEVKKGYEHHISELQGENEILTKENKKLKERIKQLQVNNTQRLQNEIEMLKTTIARNEAYIEIMQHIGPWKK